MSQLLLQGFPDGAIKIGTFLSILEKDGIRTYFTGADNYFSHRLVIPKRNVSLSPLLLLIPMSGPARSPVPLWAFLTVLL